jgi:uncharacterized protein (TIGR03067 family)
MTRAAMQIAAGRPLAGAVSPAVLIVMKGVSRGLFMNRLKATALAVVTLGALAAGAGGLAWAALGQPASDQEAPPRPQPSRPAAGEEGRRNQGPGPAARDAADLRGSWEVLYVAGTAAGQREGYAMPLLIVPATDKTINLPALTGKPKDPLNYLGAMSYTLDPGRKSGGIDMKAAAGGKVLRGIYRLKGDILTICYDASDRGRPETFADKKPSESLIILRRREVPSELEAVPRPAGPRR